LSLGGFSCETFTNPAFVRGFRPAGRKTAHKEKKSTALPKA
jgi:hypothetical protein